MFPAEPAAKRTVALYARAWLAYETVVVHCRERKTAKCGVSLGIRAARRLTTHVAHSGCWNAAEQWRAW